MRKLFLLFALIAAAGASAQKRSFRVLTYNVCEGLKMDTTASKERFVAWMRELDPDLAALQEMNGFTQARLEKLAAAYGHSHAVLLKDTGYPVALTSKYPIVAKRVTDNMHHGFLIARTGGYNIVVAHLSPFSWRKRQQEVATIRAWIAASGERRRWIVLGDLNSCSPLDREGYADGRLRALNRRGDDPRTGRTSWTVNWTSRPSRRCLTQVSATPSNGFIPNTSPPIPVRRVPRAIPIP